MDIAALTNVSKTYRMGEAEVAAPENVSLAVPRGAFAALAGPLGSGKNRGAEPHGLSGPSLLGRGDGGRAAGFSLVNGRVSW